MFKWWGLENSASVCLARSIIIVLDYYSFVNYGYHNKTQALSRLQVKIPVWVPYQYNNRTSCCGYMKGLFFFIPSLMLLMWRHRFLDEELCVCQHRSQGPLSFSQDPGNEVVCMWNHPTVYQVINQETWNEQLFFIYMTQHAHITLFSSRLVRPLRPLTIEYANLPK